MAADPDPDSPPVPSPSPSPARHPQPGPIPGRPWHDEDDDGIELPETDETDSLDDYHEIDYDESGFFED